MQMGGLALAAVRQFGDVQPDSETPNGYIFHQWLLRVQAAAFNTFRIKGPGATWKSSTGHLRHIDFVCGCPSLMTRQFDTWVDKTIDVATVRDDHDPGVLELLWQPLAVSAAPQWLNPIMDRSSMSDPALSRLFQDNLSRLLVPDVATPIDAFSLLCCPFPPGSRVSLLSDPTVCT